MKHVFTIMAVAMLLNFSAHAQGQKSKSKTAMQASMHEDESLPYTALYSSKFQMGNAKYSQMVLNAWKAYDDNVLDNIADNVSDTVTAVMPDGSVLKGKDNFLTGIKPYRSGFTSAKSEVDAWLPVKSMDKGDDIVCIWGHETDTKSDGTIQKVDLHEVWAFNKDGKLFYFRQFAGQSPKDRQ